MPPPTSPSDPRLSWPDLAGRRVGVWGLGVEGTASIRLLRAMGVAPVLVDDAGSSDGNGSTVDGEEVLPTAGAGLAALAGCDVVVKTPGISRYRPEVAELAGRGVRVTGGLALWLAGADRSKVL